jgi:serine O-acetyltransferase
MRNEFLQKIWAGHENSEPLPSHSSITRLVEEILSLLFPQLSEVRFKSIEEINDYANKVEDHLLSILKKLDDPFGNRSEKALAQFRVQLPIIYEILLSDARAIAKGDPAARNTNEVIRTYPGFYAIAVYRIAHLFYNQNIPYLPRILTEYAHEKTGIDINPGAKIGTGFCIDHGTGIVIGETAVIGNNVKIYQGVTLGALSVAKEMAKIKRHPTIEDNVIIYSGATILGGNTVVGQNSVIGGNVWLIKSVPPLSRVYHKSQIEISNAETEIVKIRSLNPSKPIPSLQKIV